MTLMARWSGVCPECGETWQPGDLIRAAPDGECSCAMTEGSMRRCAVHGEDDHMRWQHAVCPDPLTTDHPVCQTCWLTHPEGACDR